MPPSHPYNPLPSLRLCISAGSKITHVQSIFNVIYRDGVQPDSEEGIGKIAKALGISSEEIESNKKESKRILRKNTEEAISNGVFGVPTFLIDKELFWGGDSLDMMLDYLDNRDLFNTPKMKRINEMPMGLIRKK
jgi:2-hydroxychromene-2-carboxylate isomerase